jgi:hypothetical protein
MPGEVLYGGQSLVDGSYTMAMQTDGNFVLYANGNQALAVPHVQQPRRRRGDAD